MDPIGVPIEGKYDFGHDYGFEYWRLKAWAESRGMTQAQFNNFVNNAEFYRIEIPSYNRSHAGEMKGTFVPDYSEYLKIK